MVERKEIEIEIEIDYSLISSLYGFPIFQNSIMPSFLL
jgi:hypothetical protein